MDIEVLIRFDASRFEHARPIDAMGFQDIFGNDMLCRGPKFPECFTIGEAYGRDIVNEGIKPDICDEIFIKGQGDPPAEP
jgi:hypothetical protein